MWRLFDQLLWLYSPVSQCPIVPFISRCCNSDQLIGSNYRLYMIEVVERLALVLLLLSSWSDNTLLRNQRGAHMVQELRPEVQVLWMTKGPPHLHHHHLWLQGPTKHITLVIVSLFIFLMSISMHCHTHNHCHFEWCYSNIKALQTTQGRYTQPASHSQGKTC